MALAGDATFTIEAWAEALGVDAAEVKNRLRTLGRSKVIREYAHQYGKPLLPWRAIWNGTHNVYAIDSDWRNAILEAGR